MTFLTYLHIAQIISKNIIKILNFIDKKLLITIRHKICLIDINNHYNLLLKSQVYSCVAFKSSRDNFEVI